MLEIFFLNLYGKKDAFDLEGGGGLEPRSFNCRSTAFEKPFLNKKSYIKRFVDHKENRNSN